jgi:hypothetical protein
VAPLGHIILIPSQEEAANINSKVFGEQLKLRKLNNSSQVGIGYHMFNFIGGVMVSMLSLRSVDHGFVPFFSYIMARTSYISMR